MLKPISELPEQDRFNALMLGWVAIDTDSGAYLFRTYGRTSKAPKYILILPSKTITERRSLFHDRNWDYPHGRKIVRAWSDEDAINDANGRLPKMLEQRSATMVGAA